MSKQELLYRVVMSNKSLRDGLYKQLLKGHEGLLGISKDSEPLLEELREEIQQYKSKVVVVSLGSIPPPHLISPEVYREIEKESLKPKDNE